MNKRLFRSYPIGLIIVVSCLVVVTLLVLSIFTVSYTNFTKNTAEEVNFQTGELSTQIVYNYENYISSVIDLSNTIQVDINKYVFDASGAKDFTKYLSSIVHLNSDI
ncbi:MAG: hypothetical protein RR086_06875, partial [Clostridia bacterium]